MGQRVRPDAARVGFAVRQNEGNRRVRIRTHSIPMDGIPNLGLLERTPYEVHLIPRFLSALD